MNFHDERLLFDKNARIYETAVLKFTGADGFDVYNASTPFMWQGSNYIFGRVERRHEQAKSHVRLFKQVDADTWAYVPDSMRYDLEDPCIAIVHGEVIMEGTHVVRSRNNVVCLMAYFYRGRDLNDLFYFTTGPDHMKDIRLVEMSDGKVGVFSRPRFAEGRCQIGMNIINTVDELDEDVIQNAPFIEGLFGDDEWGGANQCYQLDSGLIGIIGHKSYVGDVCNVYTTIAFVVDPRTRKLQDSRIICTRSSFAPGETKIHNTSDTTFPCGIVMRPDGKADLYTGLNDIEIGRAVIDNPFEGFGNIVHPKQ